MMMRQSSAVTHPFALTAPLSCPLSTGYSPYGGAHGAGRLLGDPRLAKIAAAHGTGAAQVVLRWQWQLGIVVNPEAQKLQYQLENLEFFNFTLTDTEMATLSNWR